MLGVMLQKIWHKKWMIMCLLLGSVLLIATVVSFPLYRNAAFDRMLQDEFNNYLQKNGEWPTELEMTIISKKEAGGTSMKRMESFLEGMYEDMGVEKDETVLQYSLQNADAISQLKQEEGGTLSLRIGMMSNLPAHAEVISGQMYSEDGLDENGAIEVVISQECMVRSNLLLGETVQFKALKDYNGKAIKLKVVGVYGKKTTDDFYWQVSPDSLFNVCLMEENLFREYFTGDNAQKYSINCSYFALIDYEKITSADVHKFAEQTDYLLNESSVKSTVKKPAYVDVLDGYLRKQDRIAATLFILQMPVLILLCAFLFMLSGQMYDMERNEISVYKSRGSSGGQILRLYFYQSVFLTIVGAVLGIPLGTVFCRILGSARNFLEFDMRGDLSISFTADVAYYALAAMAASIMIMTIPAFKHSRLSIVKLKQQKSTRSKSWWEKAFIDVICLGVALYGYYSFAKNTVVLTENVLKGESLDPLLYLSSSLFIIGVGLVLLRLQPVIVRFIYVLGKKSWSPANYASFMENLKNGRKQQFIMLFMMLTISLGMYHATVARTILQNAKDNADYINAADVIIKEKWDDNSAFAAKDPSVSFQYYEPDFSKYAQLESVKSYTKVLVDEKGKASNRTKGSTDVTLMGIHTKEFGENTNVPRYLLEKHYYEYLNILSREPKGVLVSRNFQTQKDFKIGDQITYYDQHGHQAYGKILEFFDYWPGYEPITTSLNPDGGVVTTDNYVVVTHLATLQQSWGTVPYEVWMTLEEGADADEIYQWIQDNDVRVVKYSNKAEELQRVVEDPLLQGTNGVLTMGFLVTIILCAVGYLIYWIMSIRSREMLFGVLRACGMHKGELFQMLINEQIFSGVFSILAGIGIGKVASDMFVPIIQTAYAASNQVLPMRLITNPVDMIRLYGVVVAVMAVCLMVLIWLVFKLNVAKALKLGEE